MKLKLSQLSGSTLTSIAVITSTICAGIILVMLISILNLQSQIQNLLLWINEKGFWAPAVFILIDIIVVVFLLPGVFVTMGAGFLFGVIKGSIYVVIATTTGAVISFIVARYLFKNKTADYFLSHPKLLFINQLLDADGWKIILMTRLIPFFPFKLSNYLFGLTKFRLHSFFIGTFLGIWPITIFNVYVGSLAMNLSRLGEIPESRSNWQLYLYIAGFIVCIFSLTYIGRHAKKALDKYAAENKTGKQDGEENEV